jgi:hypothetical protein
LKLPSLPVVETAGVEPAINQQGPLIPKNLARINPRFNPGKGQSLRRFAARIIEKNGQR